MFSILPYLYIYSSNCFILLLYKSFKIATKCEYAVKGLLVLHELPGAHGNPALALGHKQTSRFVLGQSVSFGRYENSPEL